MLYTQKSNCCGCQACANVCPTDAITCIPDEYGFLYPDIDSDKCIQCGACTSVCDFQSKETADEHMPLQSYVAAHKEKPILKRSSSGGVFTALANCILSKKGIVFGCVLNDEMIPVHIAVEAECGLEKMRGSKYVQSDIGYAYRHVKQCLDEGRHVLFTGTPCQNAALNRYLRKVYPNLLAVDFVCHGVPSRRMFVQYIRYLEQKHKVKIIDFRFRSKARGWPGLLASYQYVQKGKVATKLQERAEEFYYPYFLKGQISRPSCYTCKYASPHRRTDITMGDFWGYQRADLHMRPADGLSICLFNTNKALRFLYEMHGAMHFEKVGMETIISGNRNLRHPEKKGDQWERVMTIFANEGVEPIAKQYLQQNRINIYRSKLRSYKAKLLWCVPEPLRVLLVRVVRLLNKNKTKA